MLHFSRWYAAVVITLSVASIVLAGANMLPRSVTDRIGQIPRFVLGLDLQGGAHLLFQVDVDKLRSDRLNAVRDDVRRAVLEQPRLNIVGAIQVQQNAVTVRIREEAQFASARTRLQALAQPVASPLAFGNQLREIDVTEPEPGRFELRLTEPGINERIRMAIEQSIEIIRRRIDPQGTVEATIVRQGRDQVLVQVPGEQDPERVKRLVGETGQLTFRMVDQSMTAEQAQAGRPPPDSELLVNRDGGMILVERQVLVAGEDLSNASAGFNQQTNEPIVNFQFNSNGARRFGEATRNNVGRPFAIVLDNQVISAPVIREPILGGQGQISGSFSVQTANELSILLRSGALPARLVAIEERTVGPGLGADSIAAGINATIIATVLVSIFMLLCYGTFGVFANIALLVHVAMILGLLALTNSTLTLPGIAGIVLTVGTAVDSNVLIYERIREEWRGGQSLLRSIEMGFNRAFATIIDSNSTMAIAALILYAVGSGPVRGFAVVFLFGIFTTVITAVTMTRMMIAVWFRYARPSKIPF